MDIHRQIKVKRDAAAKARRLAFGVTNPDVIEQLLALAKTLEAEAAALERQMQEPPAPDVAQVQMQL